MRLTAYDVVGVDNEDNGRSCESHIACGKYVDVGDILLCEWSVQQFRDDTSEACVRVHRINSDGLVGCHVGYLPKRCLKGADTGKHLGGMVLQVVEDLRLSENTAVCSRSHRNYGILYCHNVSDDPHYAGKDPLNGDPFDMTKWRQQKMEVNIQMERSEDSFGNDSFSDGNISSDSNLD